MTNVLNFLNRSLGTYKIKGIYIEPTYWQAAAIIFLLFLLVLTLARLRYIYVHWSFKSNWSMLFMGFLLALILEGFLIIGGKTILTEVIGWKSAPKPVSTALELGRNKLIDVLGISKEIPTSNAKDNAMFEGVIDDFQNLSSREKEELRAIICKP